MLCKTYQSHYNSRLDVVSLPFTEELWRAKLLIKYVANTTVVELQQTFTVNCVSKRYY